MNEERLELLGALVESRLAVVVVATVVEDLRHVLDEVVEAIVLIVEDFRLDLLEICGWEWLWACAVDRTGR